MDTLLASAAGNLLTPQPLFFLLGLLAAFARSDLSVPEAVAKGLALYLMAAIGFKGGVEVAKAGLEIKLMAAMGLGAILSAAMPVLAYGYLRRICNLSAIDAGAIAAHYGSISIVTFIAGVSALSSYQVGYEGWMVAVAAVMETPAILVGLALVRWGNPAASQATIRETLHEVSLNASVVVLVGAFIIGIVVGEKGMADVQSFFVAPFKGVLCLFLLDMGLVAGRNLMQRGRDLSASLLAFGIIMPLVGAGLGLGASLLLQLSIGGTLLMMILGASASYIAVPAAIRLALPEANTGLSLTLSLGVTFPFNIAIGIPLYWALLQWMSK